jgi:hypothetical protein
LTLVAGNPCLVNQDIPGRFGDADCAQEPVEKPHIPVVVGDLRGEPGKKTQIRMDRWIVVFHGDKFMMEWGPCLWGMPAYFITSIRRKIGEDNVGLLYNRMVRSDHRAAP